MMITFVSIFDIHHSSECVLFIQKRTPRSPPRNQQLIAVDLRPENERHRERSRHIRGRQAVRKPAARITTAVANETYEFRSVRPP